jgi:hypothetical protein
VILTAIASAWPLHGLYFYNEIIILLLSNEIILAIDNNQFSLGKLMNLALKKLNNLSLMKQTHASVKEEKRLTLLLLEHLLEIENRGLHLERGFFNLHNLLVAEFKYSDSEAATRLQAMRLLKTYPEIKEKISDGKISLCQAADLNRFLTVEKKSAQAEIDSNAPLALMEKRGISIENIINNIEGKSIRESKELLEKLRSIPKAKKYLVEIDEEAWQLLQEIKKSEGTTARDGDVTKKIFKEKLIKIQAIKEKEQKKQQLIQNEKPIENINSDYKSKKFFSLKGPQVRSRYIAKKNKQHLLKAANYQCEYVAPLTGKRCECKINLQVDHLYPYAWGGLNTIENTRIRCGQHNLLYAEELFGKEKMARWRKP